MAELNVTPTKLLYSKWFVYAVYFTYMDFMSVVGNGGELTAQSVCEVSPVYFI